MTAPSNGPDNFASEREWLFTQLAVLRGERDALIRQLAECQRALRECQQQRGDA